MLWQDRNVPEPERSHSFPELRVTTSHGTRASNGQVTTSGSSNLLAKLNRVAFAEFFDDGKMMLKRIQFELLRVVDAHRAATDERPEPREEPKS